MDGSMTTYAVRTVLYFGCVVRYAHLSFIRLFTKLRHPDDPTNPEGDTKKGDFPIAGVAPFIQ